MNNVAVALADSIRREILDLLRDGPRSAGDLAARFPVSRPAISRHLRVLREASLVVGEPSGRLRLYRLETGPLAPLEAWLAGLRERSDWPRRLDALKTEVYRTRRERRDGAASRALPQPEERSA